MIFINQLLNLSSNFNITLFFLFFIYSISQMLSPRSNYITLLKSKRDTSIDKTRQVYMSKYNYNSQNKKIRDKTHRE